MFQARFDVMERIGSVRLSKGDRLIAESAARGAESAVELLCRAAARIALALTPARDARAQIAA